MSESHESDTDKMPDDEELQEPSTEKDPGEEPKDGDDASEEADHEAVGIGIIEDASADDQSTGEELSPSHPTAAEAAMPDSAPPTDAASDEVRSDAAGVDGPDESGE